MRASSETRSGRILPLLLLLHTAACASPHGRHLFGHWLPAEKVAVPLAFRQDGTFTIVQFTDTHLHGNRTDDRATYRLMATVLEQEQPDLIVLTGDIVRARAGTPPAPATWQRLIAFLDEYQVPWAYIYGNHDTELTSGEVLDRVLATSRYGRYQRGPASVAGRGNYVLPIRDRGGAVGALLWFFDSGTRSDRPSGYGWVEHSQVDWFREQHQTLRQEPTAAIPQLAFFHIPLPQYAAAWEEADCTGVRQEEESVQGEDGGLFEALQTAGITATFCGHDHLNDYSCHYRGMTLAYGRASGYGGYGRGGYQRGARVIILHEGTQEVTTYHRLADGSRLDPTPSP